MKSNINFIIIITSNAKVLSNTLNFYIIFLIFCIARNFWWKIAENSRANKVYRDVSASARVKLVYTFIQVTVSRHSIATISRRHDAQIHGLDSPWTHAPLRSSSRRKEVVFYEIHFFSVGLTQVHDAGMQDKIRFYLNGFLIMHTHHYLFQYYQQQYRYTSTEFLS